MFVTSIEPQQWLNASAVHFTTLRRSKVVLLGFFGVSSASGSKPRRDNVEHRDRRRAHHGQGTFSTSRPWETGKMRKVSNAF